MALLGPNGSGKTTLLRLVATDLTPSRGSLRLFGRPARAPLSPLRRRLGYLPDEGPHLEPLSGLANAVLFGRLAGLAEDRSRDDALGLFRKLDLADDAGAPVATWSFGMRRKLLLTQAFLHRPDLILLDEPTVGLDPPSLAALRLLLAERLREGTGVLLATNDVREATRLATRVAFLHRGEVVLEGDPGALLEELGGTTRIEVAVEGRVSPRALDLPGTLTVEVTPGRVVATGQEGPKALLGLLKSLVDGGLAVRGVRVREPHLGDVFRQATGVELSGEAGDRP